MYLHIVINNNSLSYLYYMKRNIQALADKPDQLRFWIYCTELNAFEHVKNCSWVERCEFSKHNGGSGGHADALHMALSLMKRDDINILIDADMVLLMMGWDSRIRKIMEKVHIFGTSHLDPGLSADGYGEVEDWQYARLPNTSFFVMNPNHDFSDIDLKPNKEKKILVDNIELSILVKLPINSVMHCDTGWQIPWYVEKYKLQTSVVRHRKPRNYPCSILKKGMNYSEEFVLDNVPFIAHQRGSWKRCFRKDTLSKLFYNATEEYLVKIPHYTKKHGFTSNLLKAKVRSILY